MSKLQYKTATIANGAQVSNVIDLQSDRLVGIIFPAAVDGTIDLDVVHANTGAALTYKTGIFAASTYLPITDGEGVGKVQVSSSVNQTADREFMLVVVEE